MDWHPIQVGIACEQTFVWALVPALPLAFAAPPLTRETPNESVLAGQGGVEYSQSLHATETGVKRRSDGPLDS